MRNKLFFGSHLGYLSGGAELSMLHLIEKFNKSNNQIYSFYFNSKYTSNKKLTNKIKYIYFFSFLHQYLPFLNYFINSKIKLKVEHLKNYEVHTYSRYGINFIKQLIMDKRFEDPNKCYFYIRSITDLAIIPKPINKNFLIIKSIFNLLDKFFVKYYIKDLKFLSNKVQFVSNSKYTQGLLLNLYNINSKIIYPQIDIRGLVNIHKNNNKKYITFVGDSSWKGVDIFLKIAELLPSYQFLIYSRFVKNKFLKKNITYKPWVSNNLKIYEYSSMVLVPSQVPETYGRVSREAFLLKIPLLVSNIGALPETVDFRKNYIVLDYKNPNAWVQKIRESI